MEELTKDQKKAAKLREQLKSLKELQIKTQKSANMALRSDDHETALVQSNTLACLVADEKKVKAELARVLFKIQQDQRTAVVARDMRKLDIDNKIIKKVWA